jgi:hypothetical protein
MLKSLCAVLLFFISCVLFAKVPATLKVVDLQEKETLNLREQPSIDSKSLVKIPHNARQIKFLGKCLDKNGAAIDSLLAPGTWCNIQYETFTGWAFAQYLRADDTKD